MKGLENFDGKIIIPFLPGDCHNCNIGFFRNLKLLEADKSNILFLIPDQFSDDVDEIITKYKFENFKKEQFIFSTSLLNKYRIYEQSFVMQYGVDSNYKIYDNAKNLKEDLLVLNKAEKIDLKGYNVKKSTDWIIAKNKEQMCVTNMFNTASFDYLDFRNGKNIKKNSFTDEQLKRNFILFFKDSSLAINKLNEVNAVNDLTEKNLFLFYEFVGDSLFVSSNHTYIASIKDSVLGGFLSMNIYKDGKYITSRSLSSVGLPPEYTVMPKFHFYNGALFVKVVKQSLEADRPNFFMAKFELSGKEYRFKKMLNFTLPEINKHVGYVFTDFSFSGKYFVNPISNILYDLESETSVPLKIPLNEKFEYGDMVSGFKGIELMIRSINVNYPNMLMWYTSRDEKGIGTHVLINYNLNVNNIVGRVSMPEDNSKLISPDLSKFGYYFWMPQKDNYDNLIYKKVF